MEWSWKRALQKKPHDVCKMVKIRKQTARTMNNGHHSEKIGWMGGLQNQKID